MSHSGSQSCAQSSAASVCCSTDWCCWTGLKTEVHLQTWSSQWLSCSWPARVISGIPSLTAPTCTANQITSTIVSQWGRHLGMEWTYLERWPRRFLLLGRRTSHILCGSLGWLKTWLLFVHPCCNLFIIIAVLSKLLQFIEMILINICLKISSL